MSASLVGSEMCIRDSSWNVRWLVSLATHRNKAKRRRVRDLLSSGHVVALQETHWSGEEAALWAGQFPLAQLVHSPCRRGPRGGPQGGVRAL
eukprot:15312267-Alexandrium_andersonii.AAC.1